MILQFLTIKVSNVFNRCRKMLAISNRWRQKTQGQLSPPTICLAAKKWTTQKTTKAWIVEGAGDGFEFLLALLVQNGIPCTYYLVIRVDRFSYSFGQIPKMLPKQNWDHTYQQIHRYSELGCNLFLYEGILEVLQNWPNRIKTIKQMLWRSRKV